MRHRRKSVYWVGLVVFAGLLTACRKDERPQITQEALLEEMVSMEENARYPEIPYRSLQAGNYDLSSLSLVPGEWFTYMEGSGKIKTETRNGRTEMVLFDKKGPGAITRIWTTIPEREGTWRFYFDNSPVANWESPSSGLMRILAAPPGNELLKGGSLYLPVPYGKRCKITFEDVSGAEPAPVYYQIDYRQYPEGVVVKTVSSETDRQTKKRIENIGRLLLNPETKCDTLIRKAGQRLRAGIPLRLNLPKGEHAVCQLKIKITADQPEDFAQVMRNIMLKGMFDGKQTIQVPVSDFSGGGWGAPPVQNWLLESDGQGSLTSRWPMPYREMAYMALTNEGEIPADVEISVCLHPIRWDSRTLYFHTSWRQERGIKLNDASEDGENAGWNLATIQGRGVYKGKVLTLLNHSTEWDGVGNENIRVDEEAFPSHTGARTEDDYDKKPDASGYNTSVRIRNLDGIPFGKSLKFDLETTGQTKGTVDYTITIFWYGDVKARAQREPG